MAWLEQRVAVAVMLLAGYFVGLPAVAERVARRVPMDTEQALGRQALAWLDDNHWFAPSRIGRDLQDRIRLGFDELRSGLPNGRYCRPEFRESGVIGPNAFALPGGTIVITDEMVQMAQSPEEVLAVLAHELGRVELRHATRHVLQNSATAVAAATVTGDAASLGVAVAGLPVLLARMRYSREFEAEADEFGFRLLKHYGLAPDAFATLMERLAGNRVEAERTYGFLSSHPVTADRIRRACAAAVQPSHPPPAPRVRAPTHDAASRGTMSA